MNTPQVIRLPSELPPLVPAVLEVYSFFGQIAVQVLSSESLNPSYRRLQLPGSVLDQDYALPPAAAKGPFLCKLLRRAVRLTAYIAAGLITPMGVAWNGNAALFCSDQEQKKKYLKGCKDDLKIFCIFYIDGTVLATMVSALLVQESSNKMMLLGAAAATLCLVHAACMQLLFNTLYFDAVFLKNLMGDAYIQLGLKKYLGLVGGPDGALVWHKDALVSKLSMLQQFFPENKMTEDVVHLVRTVVLLLSQDWILATQGMMLRRMCGWAAEHQGGSLGWAQLVTAGLLPQDGRESALLDLFLKLEARGKEVRQLAEQFVEGLQNPDERLALLSAILESELEIEIMKRTVQLFDRDANMQTRLRALCYVDMSIQLERDCEEKVVELAKKLVADLADFEEKAKLLEKILEVDEESVKSVLCGVLKDLPSGTGFQERINAICKDESEWLRWKIWDKNNRIKPLAEQMEKGLTEYQEQATILNAIFVMLKFAPQNPHEDVLKGVLCIMQGLKTNAQHRQRILYGVCRLNIDGSFLQRTDIRFLTSKDLISDEMLLLRMCVIGFVCAKYSSNEDRARLLNNSLYELPKDQVVEYVTQLCESSKDEEDQEILEGIKEFCLTQWPIGLGADFMVREVLHGASKEVLDNFADSDANLMLPVLTRAIYIYVAGARKSAPIPDFFKPETRKKIVELRNDLNMTGALEGLAQLVHQEMESSSEDQALKEEHHTEALEELTQLTNQEMEPSSGNEALKQLRGVACGELQDGAFITQCWPLAITHLSVA